MAVTLAQYRVSLGSVADGLSDAELQKRLDYTYRFAESFYDWWHERKGGASCSFGGQYERDSDDDMVRRLEKIKATEPRTFLVVPADETIKRIKEKYENRAQQK